MALTPEEMARSCINAGPEPHYVYPSGDEVSNVEIVYLCRRWRGEPAMRDGEMEDLRFFAVEEIDLDQISPPIRPVIQKYIQSVK